MVSHKGVSLTTFLQHIDEIGREKSGKSNLVISNSRFPSGGGFVGVVRGRGINLYIVIGD